MEELKTDINGQPGTVVTDPSAPEVIEMTAEELDKKMDDPKFADDYLAGRIKIEEPKEEPAAASAAAAPAAKAEAPVVTDSAKTPEPSKKETVITPTDDGKYEVEFEDGRKIKYNSKNEMLKGVKEKENMITRQKVVIQELKARDEAQKAELEALRKLKATPPAAPAAPAKPKEEAPAVALPEDEFDPDYQKNLRKLVMSQAEELKAMKELREEDKKEREKEKADAQRKDEAREATQRMSETTKQRFADVNSFISRPKFVETNPGFKLERPLEIVDREYTEFLKELGELAGTDGTLRQNVGVFDIYLDSVSERGKKLKEEAEKLGVRPPAEYPNYLNILHLLNKRDTLLKNDPVSGKMIPFTLEETHRYLKAQESEAAPANPPSAPPGPAQPAEAKPPEKSPRAAAIDAAAALEGKVATDVPPASSGPAMSYADMSQEQIAALMDTPVEKLRADPLLRKKWEGAFVHIGQKPPRLDGV